MIRALFADPIDYRHKDAIKFIRQATGNSKDTLEVVHARAIDGFWKVLRLHNQEPFDYFFLDTNLGKGYGEELGDWMVANLRFDCVKKVYIHTWDTSNAEKLVKRLKDNGFETERKPFQITHAVDIDPDYASSFGL